MKLVQIQFRQTPAKLDIRSTSGRFDIATKSATMDIRTTKARLDITSEPPVVLADMTKTWEALTGGPHLAFMSRIYNQFGQYVIQSIENTVREYNQIGDLTQEANAIPELALQSMFRKPPQIQLYGEASAMNLSYEVQLSKPQVHYTPGSVQANITPNKPQVNYQRGGVQIRMAQYPSVTYQPLQIDFIG